ncbi:MAG: hypothetical protein C0456_12250 [Hyphomonas sp.]|nr:hypothetical protein [Hyphomonas sp.]
MPAINWRLVAVCLAAIGAVLIALVCLNVLPPIWIGPEYTQNRYEMFNETSQRWMAISSVIMLFVSSGTLALLAWTLVVTRGLLKAAEAANSAVLHIGEKQSQAYLDAQEGIALYLRVNRDKRDLVHDIRIQFKNYGASPAYQCKVKVAHRIVEDTDEFIYPPHLEVDHYSLLKNLAPNDTDRVEVAPRQKLAVDFGNRLEVWGEVYYKNVYGRELMTQFFYAFLPSSGAMLSSRITEEAIAVQGRPIGFDALKVFAPCTKQKLIPANSHQMNDSNTP